VKRDYYDILAVDRRAGPDEIKKAYRRLAHEHHPDKNPGDETAEARFKEASEAYAVLSDAEKRATYDRFGHDGLAAGAGGDPFAGFDPFSSFADLFNEFFGGERAITVPKHRACESCNGLGGERELCQSCQGHGQVLLQQGFFRISRACDACRGGGQTLRSRCGDCGGRGRTETVQKMNVRIPAGVETGVRLRLSGEGEAGFDGGPPGDLYVVLHVREHPLFQREGPDLRCELPISIAQAALGCDVEVPTLEGKQTITVHPGTQSGETLRLREKGLPRLGGGPAGDQYVEIFVEIPTRLSSEQRELLERFAEVSGDDVSPRRRGFLDKLRELFD
jgi:molecular chaperone DnaJ